MPSSCHAWRSPSPLQVALLLSRLAVTERASIDEVYLDVTQEATRRLADVRGDVAWRQRQQQRPESSKEEPPPPPPEPESFLGIYVPWISPEASGTEGEPPSFEVASGRPPRRGCGSDGEAACSATDAPSTTTVSSAAAASAAERWWRRPAEDWLRDPNERLLAAGACVVSELRADVLRELGFTCSAGVAHHKILCKLGSGKIYLWRSSIRI